MRKRYIFWWVLSALFFWNAVSELLWKTYLNMALLFFLISGVLFFVGYLRHREYEKQSEDREALHRFVDHATSEDQKKTFVPNQSPATFEDCVYYALEANSVSVSSIQRELKVGYSQAARWMDEMYSLGIVGPYEGSNPRKVLFSPDEWPGLEELRKRQSESILARNEPSKNNRSETLTARFSVVGETFKNEGGKARQIILKKAYDEDCVSPASLELYSYQGEPAIHILYNGEVVGNIARKEVEKVALILDSVVSASLFVDRFIPDDENRKEDNRRAFVGEYIYYAEVSIRYH